MVSYDMIRKSNEERRERSLRRFWWRYRVEEIVARPIREADVIELAFGPRCEMEEPIGA
jgi:hypothetical protein